MTSDNESPPINRDDVAKVAALARLELTEHELETFTDQLADVLEHAADMAELDLGGVEPLGTPVALENVLRADQPADALDRDEVLASAPAAEDGMFKVTSILGDAS
ncbi:MAG: Asp-tRNA(Asn)/Glu-tRNA(Gln) amidotransferase subunit GatC [Microthrixaceae bacterium]